MESSSVNSLTNICRILHQHKVKFMMVGGMAVGFYGYQRHSLNAKDEVSEKPDFDFWYNPTYDNYYRLLKVLSVLGVDITRYMEEKTPRPKQSFFKLELSGCSLDFLPSIKSAVKFRQAFLTCEIIILEDVEIPIIGLEELIADKQIQPRAKDIHDVEMLKKSMSQNKDIHFK